MSDEIFLNLCRAALTLRKMRQWKVAARLGVSDSYLNKMLHGNRPMPPEIKDQLIEILGIEHTWAKLSGDAEIKR